MINLVETIQKNLQYPGLHKIDPRTEDKERKEADQDLGQLAQAAILAVLAGLYKLSRNDEGCLKIINAADTGDSLAILFQKNVSMVVENVARYAGLSANQAESHLENIADESIRLVKLVADGSPQKLNQHMNDQRHNILMYLPVSLNLGDVLLDEEPNDKTNKMEGPFLTSSIK
ncbi:MAG TPA: hypothetical protein VMZ03_14060 [Chitinophagaceae bacterium]|nr:hypothetical protein [Chitinophagaceae bacterium]